MTATLSTARRDQLLALIDPGHLDPLREAAAADPLWQPNWNALAQVFWQGQSMTRSPAYVAGPVLLRSRTTDPTVLDRYATARRDRLRLRIDDVEMRPLLRSIAEAPGDFSRWRDAYEWIRTTAWLAYKMADIESVGAPICDEHGCMIDVDNGDVPASADGRHWMCAETQTCTARYWWLDGTHYGRGRRS